MPFKPFSTPNNRLNIPRTVLIGFGFFAGALLWALYNSFVPLLLKKFITSSAIVGAIMTIDNLFGVVFQPLFGAMSDRTKTRFGRRMPFILIGAPICGVLFALIPFTQNIFLMMLFIITFNFTMSAWRAPMIALMPDLTPPHLRSRANGVINLMGGIAAIIAFLGGGRLADVAGVEYAFLMGSVIMLISVGILFAGIKENKLLREMHFNVASSDNAASDNTTTSATITEHNLTEKSAAPAKAAIQVQTETTRKSKLATLNDVTNNLMSGLAAFHNLSGAQKTSLLFMLLAIFFWFCGYNAFETFYTSFAVTELNLSKGQATLLLAYFSVSFVVFAVPAGYLGEKFGRRKLILIGLIAVLLLFLGMAFSNFMLFLRIGLIFAGAFWACVTINSLPMVVELAKEKEIGTFTGYYYFFSFGASIISPILFGIIRDFTQTYQTIFVYAPVCMILAIICMLRVRHGDAQLQPVNKPGEAGNLSE